MSAIVLSGQTTYFYHTGLFREYFRRLLFFRCFLRFTATINFREDIMKKILLSLFSLVIAISLTGCFGTGGPQLPGVNTDEGVDLKKIKTSDYKNNLDDLEKYLTDLKYIPSDAEGPGHRNGLHLITLHASVLSFLSIVKMSGVPDRTETDALLVHFRYDRDRSCALDLDAFIPCLVSAAEYPDLRRREVFQDIRVMCRKEDLASRILDRILAHLIGEHVEHIVIQSLIRRLDKQQRTRGRIR